jgi:hypothetical protein
MKSMLILSQCMDLKSMMTDLGYELKIMMCLVVTVLALSLSKVVYYHYSSQQNVRKIKQLLESSRPQRRSGDLSGSGPVSPLSRIERVPTCLSLRRRSSHNSSNESVGKLKTSPPDSPASRSGIKTSTSERVETERRRRKNQIIAAEMLM